MSKKQVFFENLLASKIYLIIRRFPKLISLKFFKNKIKDTAG